MYDFLKCKFPQDQKHRCHQLFLKLTTGTVRIIIKFINEHGNLRIRLKGEGRKLFRVPHHGACENRLGMPPQAAKNRYFGGNI